MDARVSEEAMVDLRHGDVMLPGGIAGFLLLHFPLPFIVLYGLVLIVRQFFLGLYFFFYHMLWRNICLYNSYLLLEKRTRGVQYINFKDNSCINALYTRRS